MSPDELHELSLEQAPSKKKKITLEKFLQQFNTLDMNSYGSWPLSVKITCWIFIFFAVLALGYFVAIQPKLQAIDNAQAQEGNLLNEFREKDSKLRNLQQYQLQLQEMQANFNQQLEQLPKETEIPSLVEDINLTGVNSGLKFKNIRLEDEVKQEIFIEQPITIEATGDYHAFGAFVSSIAALPRIVTMHDFVVEAAPVKDSKSDIPVLNYAIKAKTYRYMGASDNQNNNDPQGINGETQANTSDSHNVNIPSIKKSKRK
ncbi:type 4a pilus biogenesis protein PilO [Acinetobacter lactucae]|uniref:type 4a pilus biogenesis protein PilO n=1 Tax=Acinetobacter lactucae TaxID=1785128 RepID=UPI001580B7BC|nr:type 4a pilus biogenesis protein PilO [Acinetobacter lactucae]NUF14481.1 type 4a pilus biogenesis protein PilO [Acinetobacter lactucae]NUF36361.1 type 4a pilus biogenesis protein PilO [Acinetobacter lactucae]NUG21946.1 type 4a pilus biogenesis protein PilO [Acinetobacter lactucae]NUG49835.1 type 4a pilus biogenesis protein PilO [Acinetobacter lactucae]